MVKDIDSDLVGLESSRVQPRSYLSGISITDIEETKKLSGGFLDSGGGQERSNSHDKTVGEIVVVGLSNSISIKFLEFHIHLEGNSKRSTNDGHTEAEESNEV